MDTETQIRLYIKTIVLKKMKNKRLGVSLSSHITNLPCENFAKKSRQTICLTAHFE